MKKEIGDFEDFRDGCKNAIPICLGYMAVSFAFGIEASKIGMTTFQAAMTSLLNVTSAGQFSALELIARNGSFVELAILHQFKIYADVDSSFAEAGQKGEYTSQAWNILRRNR